MVTNHSVIPTGTYRVHWAFHLKGYLCVSRQLDFINMPPPRVHSHMGSQWAVWMHLSCSSLLITRAVGNSWQGGSAHIASVCFTQPVRDKITWQGEKSIQPDHIQRETTHESTHGGAKQWNNIKGLCKGIRERRGKRKVEKKFTLSHYLTYGHIR